MIKELTKKDTLLESLNLLDFSNEPLFIQDLRIKAKKATETLELPTSKTEYWKYTRLGKITNNTYSVEQSTTDETIDFSNYLIPNLDAHLVILVNGFYHKELSQIKSENGFTISSLKDAIETGIFSEKDLVFKSKSESELFTAINTMSFTDGVYINIEKNANISKPIHILNITSKDGIIVNTRNVIKTHESSSVKAIESFVNIQGEKSFTNNLSQFLLEPNSKIEYNKIQNREGENYQISTEQTHQKANSTFTINTISLEGTLVRNNLNIEVDAEGCETNLNGIYLGKDSNHIDNHTVVDHLHPNCNSNEVYKGILNDNSVGVFNGKVFVRQDAQKTNAFQQNNTILLSDDATINSKPELEIYADDVKCSHGSTTGQLDEEAIFYFQSRGISKESATNLMINAFVKDALENVSIEPLRAYIDSKIEERFK